MYETSLKLRNTSPFHFYNAVKRRLTKDCIYVEEAPTSYNTWAYPGVANDKVVTDYHSQQPTILVKLIHNHDYLYYDNKLLFIMSFKFCSETKGVGYFYIKKGDR